jgi:hypothetical protein
MSPEEENENLKKQLQEMSTAFVALTAYQQEILMHEATKSGVIITLKFMAEKFDMSEESLISTYDYARSITLDRSLSDLEKANPYLAAVLDNRDSDEVPTFPEDRSMR